MVTVTFKTYLGDRWAFLRLLKKHGGYSVSNKRGLFSSQISVTGTEISMVALCVALEDVGFLSLT